ncbi:16S rRNA (cytosine967-C5)-methyltransferase [Propionicimonas paludicola]|uniref:16S rRNA (Cytosine967-C5)-methyltransferase n=1 Tax=Propionicimonas paludicola TaxID=185243 RepID=A0A2A9CQF8_9ACTN|nr:RsmB/NOP family class I SAM-dependent RNA methyltransferase [Propionicimonas paludicola]PFG16707.1 16S rRNA (cytosine967-C5)-methyltransferase [Propionicimonas paludicola]
MARKRSTDPARTAAFRVLRAVTADGAYANLELARRRSGLHPSDAAFATELTAGTCRGMGTYDEIIEAASGRPVRSLQPAVLDALRLGTHQLLAMRVPAHAAIAATVDLAALQIGERVTGVVNAILRRVAAHDLDEWAQLSTGRDEYGQLALAYQHPRWVVEAFADLLPADELPALLAADNQPPVPNLVVRPGLAEQAELGGQPARFSPYGAYAEGDPGAVPAVAQGRAGVQDEGSQLVALALARAEAGDGPWLDLCAGPGGKSALLAGLAIEQGSRLVASEIAPHRAELVATNLRAYTGELRPVTVVADGTRPAWSDGAFAKVLADVPCTGLGALRRRPESRWRRRPSDLPGLVELQKALLASAIAGAKPGGVIAYVTCSPHRAETTEVVATAQGVDVLKAADYLPEVPGAAVGDHVQLWPHRDGTDAMFLALLRKRSR